MMDTGKLTILFIDVKQEMEQLILNCLASGSGYTVTSSSMEFLQKNPSIPQVKEFDYIVLHAFDIQDVNYKVMTLFSCFRKAKTILLCENSEDFFSLQSYSWFFAIRCSKLTQDCKSLQEKLKYLYGKDECYYFQHSDTMRKLRIQEIYYIECNKNYLYINGRQDCWKDRATIKYVQDALSSYGCLLINRGIIINPTYIQSIHGNEIIMQNQRILYISRARKQEVYQKCKMRIANVLH